MGEALSWIGSLMESIGNLFPRITMLRATHQGVAFVRGKHVKVITPGIIFWWPFWTELQTYPVVRQTLNLPQQTLTTADDTSIQINTIIVYKISDIKKALIKQWDLNETIRDIILCICKKQITKHNYHDLISTKNNVDKKLTNAAKMELSPYGVEIQKVALTDCVKVQAYTLFQNHARTLVDLEDE